MCLDFLWSYANYNSLKTTCLVRRGKRNRLLTVDDESILTKDPVISKLIKLYTEYEAEATIAEDRRNEIRKSDIDEFITALLNTRAMKIAMDFLVKKKIGMLTSPIRVVFIEHFIPHHTEIIKFAVLTQFFNN